LKWKYFPPGTVSIFCFCIFLFFPGPSAEPLSLNGMGNVLIPHPRGSYKNPAYIIFPAPMGYQAGTNLPLGFLGIMKTESNPFNYLTDREKFKSVFDLVTFFDQISHPREYLLNPSASTQSVFFKVSSSGFFLSDAEGTPLAFSQITGPESSAVGGTPLLPPPLFQIPWKIGFIHCEFGLFFGGSGFSLYAGDTLKEALEEGKFFADSLYTIFSNASLSGGVQQSVSLPVKIPFKKISADLYICPRITGFYTALYGEYQMEFNLLIDPEGFPSYTSPKTQSFLVYPGVGGGGGVRFDFGAVLDFRALTAGAGIQNLAGFSRISGRMYDFTDLLSPLETDELRTFTGFLPNIIFNIAYFFPVRNWNILLAGDIGWLKSIYSHAGAAFYRDRMFFRGGLGWQGQYVWSIGIGRAFSGFWLELILRRHSALFTNDSVFGIGLNAGVYRR